MKGDYKMLSFNELESIIKTLPIGYYIKRNVEVKLDDSTKSSYYDPMNDKICISASQVNNGLANVNDSSNEEIIRSVVYHEVSHAFLTPKQLRVTRIMNIFEDERIESILKNYYMNVNFKNCIKAVNNYHGEAPTTVDEAFYHLVRFRVGEKKWLDKVHELILQYRKLNATTSSFCAIYDYELDVQKLYDEFANEWFNKQAQTQQASNESNNNVDSQNNPDASNESNDTSNDISNDEEKIEEETKNNDKTNNTQTTDDSSNDSDNTDDKIDDSSDDVNDETNDNQTDDTNESAQTLDTKQDEHTLDSELDSEAFDKISAESVFERITNEFADDKLNTSVTQILQRISKSTSRNGSAINAHSGVFDVRSTVRDDYKFFVQKNRLGHVKAFSKTHLNLFIDRSGSFTNSEETVNKLLYALHQFEKSNSDFSFTLITCGIGERIEDVNNRKLKCSGGTFLKDDIFEIFNKVQVKGEDNYNMVLFDGNAFQSSGNKIYYRKNFGAFNHANTTIISDESNAVAINKYAPCAKKIITSCYAFELVKNVLNALQMLGR